MAYFFDGGRSLRWRKVRMMPEVMHHRCGERLPLGRREGNISVQSRPVLCITLGDHGRKAFRYPRHVVVPGESRLLVGRKKFFGNIARGFAAEYGGLATAETRLSADSHGA